MISLAKNQPKYLYKLNLALVLFFILWFLLGVPLMVTVGCIYDENVITYIVMGCTFAVFFIGLAIFFAVGIKLNARLISERAAELEKKFAEMPFDEAADILKANGIIADCAFIIDDGGIFGKNTLPFEAAQLEFTFYSVETQIFLGILIYDSDGENAGGFELDRAAYNYLLNKRLKIINAEYFDPFVNDKKSFVKFVFRWGHRLFQSAQTGLN